MEPNLNSKIQNFVDLANTAYAQSGVSTRLRVAHAELYAAAGAAEGVPSAMHCIL